LLVQARDYAGNLGVGISSGFDISSVPLDAGREGAPVEFALAPPAPNPTAGRSLMSFALPRSAHVRLTLEDVQGREVAVLAEGIREAGRYTATLDSSDLRAGIYFLHMQAPGVNLARRLAVVK